MKKRFMFLSITAISALMAIFMTFNHDFSTNLLAKECDHQNLVHHERKESTCGSSGHIEYYVCCDCHNSYYDASCKQLILDTTYGLNSPLDGRYIPPHSNDGEYNVSKQPTTSEVGEAKKVCSKCGQYITKTILKLPVVTVSGNILRWNDVSNATGYKITIDGYSYDLGNVKSYALSSEEINKTVIVSAYNSSSAYFFYGGSKITTYGSNDNLLKNKNSDFENRIYTVKANSMWESVYGNFTNRDWYVYNEDNGNSAGLMTVDSNSNGMIGNIRKDIGPGLNKSGTFEVRFKIKLSDESMKNAAKRTLFANIDYSSGGINKFSPLTPIYINGLNSNKWIEVKGTFTKETSDWQQIIFFYYSSGNEPASMSDYILIDDIGIYEINGVNDLDQYEGDFEYFTNKFVGLSNVSNANTWMFNETVFIESSGIGTGIIIENDNNRALKVFGNKDEVAFNLSGSTLLLNKNYYQLSFDIKLNKNTILKSLKMIGFSLNSIAIEEINIPFPTNLSIDNYHRVSYNFESTGLGKDWVNLYFLAKVNNSSNNLNNYFLMDNFEIKLINSLDSECSQNRNYSASQLSYLTGSKATTNTLSKYNVGGTDLGIPVYDEKHNKMYFLFGDSFSGEGSNAQTGNWRSNLVGITRDFDASDGVRFDSFLTDNQGFAKEIIPSKKKDNVEMTNIPTGGIVIGDNFYVFHMSIRHWGEDGHWDINYLGCYKSNNEGQTWSRVDDLIWTEGDNSNIRNLTGLSSYECKRRTAPNFLQIFPVDGKDGYIYLYGLTNGRFGGVKLMRVTPNNIENFDEYEYYLGKDNKGNPIFEKGDLARNIVSNTDVGYIISPKHQVGEVSVMFNKYLNKWMLVAQMNNLDVHYLLGDTPWGEFKDQTVIGYIGQFDGLYCGFVHEKYIEKDGKTLYFFSSRWNEYNVTVMKLDYK